MAYLAEVQLPAASKNAADGSSTPATEYGLTMRGHLANVDNGVSGLPRMHGANLSYHILGAASAEIPMTQISTYLAVGFMRRFKEAVGKDQLGQKLTRKTVDDWVEDIGLTARQVYNDVTRMPEPDAAGYQHRRHAAQGRGGGSLGHGGPQLVLPL